MNHDTKVYANAYAHAHTTTKTDANADTDTIVRPDRLVHAYATADDTKASAHSNTHLKIDVRPELQPGPVTYEDAHKQNTEILPDQRST